MRSVDIAIVGAGLVGVPLALVLAQQGWQVALVDAGSKPTDDGAEGGDTTAGSDNNAALAQRCTALSIGTARWLAEQGVWKAVAEDACAIGRVDVTHKGYFGATRLDANELQVPAVGYVVDNREYLFKLSQRLDHPLISTLHDSRLTAVERLDGSVQLQLDGVSALEAKLLIAADGIGSIIRESAGITTRQVDYDQAAVLGMVELGQPHGGVAFERFTPTGPLAFLPRPGQYMSFVDCIDPQSQDAVKAMSSEVYLDRLQRQFGYRLGRLRSVGPRFITPLIRIEATEQIAHRTLLLGNAARLLHPVGGQGYNLAIRDMAELSSQLSGIVNGGDPGDTELLTAFVSRRSSDQRKVVRFTDTLARGFRGKAAWPAHARSAALLGLDLLSPLRRRFAQSTMGMDG